MRTFGSHFTAALGVLGLTACGLLPDVARAQEPEAYYLVDGEKVPLETSQTYSAVKIKPGTSDQELAALRASVESAGVGTVESSPILEKHGIVLIRKSEAVGPSAFAAGLESLTAEEQVEDAAPVFSVGGVDQVLVNEFVVQFRDDASESAIEASLAEAGAEVVSRNEKIPHRYVVTFTGKPAAEALSAANAWVEDELVVFAEPSFVVVVPARPRIEGGEVGETSAAEASEPSPAATPNDPLFSNQWYLHNTGSTGVSDADADAPSAWDINKGSSSIIVAIIDEGVQTTHPDLQPKIVTPYDAIDGDNNQEPNSWDGHGTACAGIAAAVTGNSQGVAGIGWNVKILPVRIAQSTTAGGPWVTTYSNIEDGIREAVDRGAHVLSNSWGGGNSNLVNSAIDYAIANNRVVVFAAGNGSGAVDWPANLSTSKVLIAVSATNEWDAFKTMTSADGETWWGSDFGPQVSVSAPGVHMYTTDITGAGGYAPGSYTATFNGTSSATPLVAGTAALVLSQNPGWSPTQVRNQIQSTADDKGPAGFDNQFGHGRVNACKALGGTAADCDPPPNCTTINVLPPSPAGNAGQAVLNLGLLVSSVLLLLLLPFLKRPQRTQPL